MTDIDTLLRAADPAAGVPDYSDAECRHLLVRAIAPTTPPKRRAGWRIGWRMGWRGGGGSPPARRAGRALSHARRAE